jgi:hypothetical protein
MKTTSYLSILPLLFTCATSEADSTLEYLIGANGNTGRQIHSVFIRNGKILIQTAGGNTQPNLLFHRAPEALFIIDHKKRSVLTLNEQQINSIEKTSAAAQPLLQGFGKQIAQLDPQQRAKWQQMLGNSVSLDKISEAAKPAKTATLLDTGKTENVKGIDCRQFNVLTDNAPSAELCLASQNSLRLSDDDYATLMSLLQFSNKIVSASHGLANQFGVDIPNFPLTDIAGIPIKISDLNKNGNGSLSLERIRNTPVSEAPMQIPKDYKSEAFALFK